MASMVFGSAPRPLLAALRAGITGHCPACTHGLMFRRYLKVHDHCPHCAEALHHQRADDAPPYFTMLIVGHVIVPLALVLERLAAPPTALHLALWLPASVILSLALLPRIKGALVAFQWANRMHGFGDHPD